MILQALYDYYQRLSAANKVPTFGFATKPCHFCIIISPSGELVQVQQLGDTPKNPSASLCIPALPSQRTSDIQPSFLCDNTGYVFGLDDKGKPDRAEKQRHAFINLHKEILRQTSDEGLRALVTFLESFDSVKAQQLNQWQQMCGKNIVFRLEHENAYLHDRPALRRAWVDYLNRHATAPIGYCLITGQKAALADTHPHIRNVKGAKPTGAALSSFNLPAFCSYGKEQNLNAPVSQEAAFAYTTALNYLLRRDSPQVVHVADSTTVFWTQRDSPVEGFFGIMLNPTDDPGDIQKLRFFLDAARSGAWPRDVDPSLPCFILGLAPNASRLAVRFWHAASLHDVLTRLERHFEDLKMIRDERRDSPFPPLWKLLRETAVEHKDDNIPPLLAGALVRAILTGSEYPLSFYTAILNRINADHEINYLRAAALKAYLVRHYRLHNQPKEVPMSLDPNNKNPGYLLGRLFALLEKAQLDALGKVDATIKDRYYGAASATPRAVFPILMRLAQHHLAKSEYGAVREREIQAVVNDLQEFPAHLSLEDQGMFAIGYYHQRHAFYNKTNA